MKTIARRSSLALLTLLLLSCTRERPGDGLHPVVGDGVPLTAHSPGPMESKAAIDGGTGVFTWAAGDQLAVFAGHDKYGSRYYMAKLPDSEAGKTSSTFKLDYYGERTNFAVYPATYALDSHPTAADLRITIPANYKMNLPASASFPPMVAVNREGEDLQFRHVCGLLRLTLNGVPVNTRRIKVWVGENIVGIYQVDVSDPNHPFVSIENPVAAGSSQDVTFTLNSAVTAGSRDGIVLDVPLPEGTYYNLGVTFYTDLTSTVYNQFRLYRGRKRVIRAGHGYAETLDCSGAVKKTLWTVSVPATSVVWGSEAEITPTISITDGGTGNSMTSQNGIDLDMEMMCFTEDPSIATAYVQPASNNARPMIVVKGIEPGETYLRVRLRYGEDYMWSARTKITVYSNNTSYMPTVKYPRYMVVGDRYQLSASLSGNFEYRNYSWEQLDGFDFATLSASGLLSATAVGTVKLSCTVTTNEGSVEKYPFSVRIINHPPGTLRGVFTSSINGDVSFFATGNLIYYKGSVGVGEYEAYDNTYDPDTMGGHFEFMSPQYEFYTGRYNMGIMSNIHVPAFDLFNYRLPMDYFGDSGSTRPVEVDGNETTGWHAPTRDQWIYILDSRPCSTVGGVENARFAKAFICNLPIQDIPGYIIFPDCYTQPSEVPVPSGINTVNYAFTNNYYTPSEWELMEQAGAVFLPLRGFNYSPSDYRFNGNETVAMSIVTYVNGTCGLYWDDVAMKGEDDGNLSFYQFLSGSKGWNYSKKTDGNRKRWPFNLRLIKDFEE